MGQMRGMSAVALVGWVACVAQSNPVNPSQSTSTLALSQDDALLYAVDTDNAAVAVIDTKSATKLTEVKVGAGAHLVAVGSDDSIYVANRYAQSVSVIHRGTWSEAVRWSAGLQPVGLTVSPDGKTLYVVSAD